MERDGEPELHARQKDGIHSGPPDRVVGMPKTSRDGWSSFPCLECVMALPVPCGGQFGAGPPRHYCPDSEARNSDSRHGCAKFGFGPLEHDAKKPAPDVIRGGHRFSENIMLEE